MSQYDAGRRIEWHVRDHLTEHGYTVLRAAGSKGPADIVAFKPGQMLLVNIKRTTMPGPGERLSLLSVAQMLPGVAVPIVALRPVRRPLELRKLTGPGPRDWRLWTADQLAEGGAA